MCQTCCCVEKNCGAQCLCNLYCLKDDVFNSQSFKKNALALSLQGQKLLSCDSPKPFVCNRVKTDASYWEHYLGEHYFSKQQRQELGKNFIVLRLFRNLQSVITHSAQAQWNVDFLLQLSFIILGFKDNPNIPMILKYHGFE